MNLSRQTVLACTVIGSIVAVLFVELVLAVRSADRAGRWVERARTVLSVSAEAEAGLARLEANLTGYEITGAAFLAADWRHERDGLLDRMWRLRALAQDDEVRSDVDLAFDRVGAYLTLHRPKPAPASIVFDRAGRARASLARRAALDDSLRVFAQLQRSEQRLVSAERAAQRSSARRALVLGIGGTVLGIGLIGALAAYLLAAVVRPIRRLGGLAARLRDGELASRGEACGHPEVAAVADALNAMASELERERTELRRSLLRHQSVVEQLPDAAVLLYDRDLRCVLAEGPMLRKQGIHAGDLLGRPLAETVPGDRVEQLEPAFRAALAGEASRLTYHSPRNDTEYDMHVVPYIAEGGIQGVYTVARDVTAGRRAERARRAAEERFREAFAHAPTGMAVTDLAGRYVEVNEALCQITGRSREALLATSFHELVHPDDLEASEDARGALVRGEVERWATEKRYLRPDGSPVAVWQHVSVVRGDEGEVVRLLSQVIDVTEQRRAEAAAAAADDRFAQAFRHAPVGMGLVDLDGRFTSVNGAFCALTGYTAEELAGARTTTITHPDDVAATQAARGHLLAGDVPHVQLEQRYLHAGGHVVDVSLHLSLVRDAEGRPNHFVGQAVDVTDRKRFEAQLRHLADHDALTGLFNRRSFEPELERQCLHVSRYGAEGALIVLDIDHFKQVNDTLGHSVGDELIVSVGAILRSRLRETDVLARLGGDEFAILLPKVDREQAELVAAALVEGVRSGASVSGRGSRRRVTISVGVAMFEAADRTADEMLVDADLAMYDAKDAGRDGYAFFVTERYAGSRTQARVQWVDRIERAIDEDGFVLHAQPVLDLHANEVTQHELLLRMRDDHGDLIPPAAFLYVAERYGLSSRIDRWVAGRAIDLLAGAAGAGRPPRMLGVNVSGHSVGDAELLAAIESDLRRTGIDPSSLVLEMTESAAVADPQRARHFAEGVAELGCRFALDDFGAGFGSFYHLKHLPFDYLKIDGEFVAKCLHTRADQLVIEAVVGIAQGLNKETVAEYVPDARTRRLLTRLGVDFAQGKHIGMPVPLERALGPEVGLTAS